MAFEVSRQPLATDLWSWAELTFWSASRARKPDDPITPDRAFRNLTLDTRIASQASMWARDPERVRNTVLDERSLRKEQFDDYKSLTETIVANASSRGTPSGA